MSFGNLINPEFIVRPGVVIPQPGHTLVYLPTGGYREIISYAVISDSDLAPGESFKPIPGVTITTKATVIPQIVVGGSKYYRLPDGSLQQIDPLQTPPPANGVEISASEYSEALVLSYASSDGPEIIVKGRTYPKIYDRVSSSWHTAVEIIHDTTPHYEPGVMHTMQAWPRYLVGYTDTITGQKYMMSNPTGINRPTVIPDPTLIAVPPATIKTGPYEAPDDGAIPAITVPGATEAPQTAGFDFGSMKTVGPIIAILVVLGFLFGKGGRSA